MSIINNISDIRYQQAACAAPTEYNFDAGAEDFQRFVINESDFCQFSTAKFTKHALDRISGHERDICFNNLSQMTYDSVYSQSLCFHDFIGGRTDFGIVGRMVLHKQGQMDLLFTPKDGVERRVCLTKDSRIARYGSVEKIYEGAIDLSYPEADVYICDVLVYFRQFKDDERVFGIITETDFQKPENLTLLSPKLIVCPLYEKFNSEPRTVVFVTNANFKQIRTVYFHDPAHPKCHKALMTGIPMTKEEWDAAARGALKNRVEVSVHDTSKSTRFEDCEEDGRNIFGNTLITNSNEVKISISRKERRELAKQGLTVANYEKKKRLEEEEKEKRWAQLEQAQKDAREAQRQRAFQEQLNLTNEQEQNVRLAQDQHGRVIVKSFQTTEERLKLDIKTARDVKMQSLTEDSEW